MVTTFRVAAPALAVLILAGCADGTKMAWSHDRLEPTEADRITCEDAVRTLEGKDHHSTALRTCLDSKTHRESRYAEAD